MEKINLMEYDNIFKKVSSRVYEKINKSVDYEDIYQECYIEAYKLLKNHNDEKSKKSTYLLNYLEKKLLRTIIQKYYGITYYDNGYIKYATTYSFDYEYSNDEDEEFSLLDKITYIDYDFSDIDKSIMIDKVIDKICLNDVEKTVFRYLLHEHNLTEIAKKMRMSFRRVKKITEEITRRLNRISKNKVNLFDF